MSAYQILMEYQHQTEALSKIAARLDWDQETMMPSGAISDRAQESAALEKPFITCSSSIGRVVISVINFPSLSKITLYENIVASLFRVAIFFSSVI